jgi:DNA-binding response OmpR family regulator
MGLNCLLLTKDAALLAAVQNGFSATSTALEMRADPATAIELSDRRHLDGFVIDSDIVPQTSDLIAQIRKSRSNKQSILVVVVNATTSASMAIDAGADFVLAKPVQDKQLQNILDIALPRMEREHRRYFRHKIDLPVELISQSGETFTAKLLNVSESGLALTRFGNSASSGVVTVRFELPSAHSQTFQAKADVVWNDSFAMGLRLLRIEPGCRQSFTAWLDSLEAQQQFRGTP